MELAHASPSNCLTGCGKLENFLNQQPIGLSTCHWFWLSMLSKLSWSLSRWTGGIVDAGLWAAQEPVDDTGAQAGHAEWDSSSQSLAMRLVLNQHPTWLSSSVQSYAHAHRTETPLELSCNCMASHLASLQPSNHFHWSIWHKQISQMRPEERYLKTWT